jgi:hypothetical protein
MVTALAGVDGPDRRASGRCRHIKLRPRPGAGSGAEAHPARPTPAARTTRGATDGGKALPPHLAISSGPSVNGVRKGPATMVAGWITVSGGFRHFGEEPLLLDDARPVSMRPVETCICYLARPADGLPLSAPSCRGGGLVWVFSAWWLSIIPFRCPLYLSFLYCIYLTCLMPHPTFTTLSPSPALRVPRGRTADVLLPLRCVLG